MPALTARDVRATRFAATKFREGYDVGDVDALLDRLAASLDELSAGRVGPDTLTGDDVLRATFQPTKFREGYDQDQVDDFLDVAVLALRARHARALTAVRAGGGSAGGRAPTGAGGAWVRAALGDLAPVRLMAGYRVADVDDALERAAQGLDRLARGHSAHLTARDLREAPRAATWWRPGYPARAVDTLIDEVAAALGE